MRNLSLSTVAVLALLASPSFAADGQAAVEKLKADFAELGTDLTWSSIRQDGPTVHLDGVTIVDKGRSNPTKLGEVTFDTISETNKAYTIGGLKIADTGGEDDGILYSVKGIAFTGLRFSTDKAAPFFAYDSGEIAEIISSKAGKQLLSAQGMTSSLLQRATGQAYELTLEAPKWTFDLMAVADAQARPIIEALGYQTLTGSFSTSGSWNPTDGKTELKQYKTVVDGAATTEMTVDISGYTYAAIKALDGSAVVAMPGTLTNDADKQKVLDGITLNGVSFKFTDASLTNKALDLYAKQNGTTRKELVNQLKGASAFVAIMIKDAALSGQITQAISSFLDNPGNLTIAAKPETPLPFSFFKQSTAGREAEIIKALGVSVTANQ